MVRVDNSAPSGERCRMGRMHLAWLGVAFASYGGRGAVGPTGCSTRVPTLMHSTQRLIRTSGTSGMRTGYRRAMGASRADRAFEAESKVNIRDLM